MTIGILGGTFNPVHNGHLFLALEAQSQLSLDRVLLIPNARPPHRDTPAVTAEVRFKMLELAVRDEPVLEASRIEIDRHGASYTVDTLLTFPEEQRLVFLCGADAFDSDWHRLDDVLNRLDKLVIAYRNREPQELPEKLDSMPVELRSKIHFLKFPNIGISSSEIRRRVKESRPIRYLIPDVVHHYIEEKQLYL